MALRHMIAMLSSDRKRIWNSVEVFQEYQAHGGINLTQSHLVDNLCSHFDGELLILSSPDYANIVAFGCQASLLLKMVSEDDDDIDNSIRKIANQVIYST